MVVGESSIATLHPIDEIISTAVNSPVKMIALLAMAQKPNKAFEPVEILDDIIDAQGKDPGWTFREEKIKVFCTNSFVPPGLVEATTKTNVFGKAVDAFRVTKKALKWAVPLFGPVLDLELGTSFSSQKMFGQINTTATEEGALVRSPLVRWRALEYIYSAAGRPVSIGQLRQAIPRERSAVDSAVNELAAAGILSVLYKSNPADRTLGLSAPDPVKIKRYRTRMRPEVAALIDAVTDLSARQVTSIRGNDLVEEVSRRLPALDKQELWHILSRQKLPYIRFDDEAVYGSNSGKDAPRTRVEITRSYESIVEELVRSMTAVRKSADYRKLAALQASKIISRKEAVAYLVTKAQVNSRQAKYNKDEAQQRMSRLAGQLAAWRSLRQQLSQSQWRNHAACLGKNTELFFAPGKGRLRPGQAAIGRSICTACLVSLQCLKWAVDNREQYGMWGGKTEKERKGLSSDTRVLLGLVQKE